jgi:hypothetical protein
MLGLVGHRGKWFRGVNLATSALDNGVHQVDEVAALVGRLVLLSEVLDGVVHEVPLLLVGVLREEEVFEVLLDVLLALFIDVRLVEVVQSSDHLVQTVV